MVLTSAMTGIEWAFITGITAFVFSNLDDLLLLALWFAEARTGAATLKLYNVVVGQYVGFSILLVLSLIGFAIGSVLPIEWIGLLGFLPILIGLHKLYHLIREKCCTQREDNAEAHP